MRASGDAPAALPSFVRWADEEEGDSGNAHASSLPFDPYLDQEDIVSRFTVIRETEEDQPALVPT